LVGSWVLRILGRRTRFRKLKIWARIRKSFDGNDLMGNRYGNKLKEMIEICCYCVIIARG
jgi:hypothetical protein